MASFSPKYQKSGSKKSHKSHPKHFSLAFESGFQHIRQFECGAFQIQWSKSKEADFFSYALLEADCLKPKPEISDSKLVWKANVLAELDCKSGDWTILNSVGKILVKSENGLGFGWLGNKAICCLHLEDWQNFFGLGEKTGSLNKRNMAFTNWNTDAFAFQDGRDPLYLSVPFYLSVHQGICYGILIDNTSKSRFNFGASNDRMVQIEVENGPLNLIFIPGPGPEDVLKRYSQLTGTSSLPPKWALGLHQCRYSYYPQHEVETIASNYRNRKIPADVIYLDIHYMDEYKVFTVDKSRFPELSRMTSNLLKQGFRLVPIQDPGIKVEDHYSVFRSGEKTDVFVKYPDGKPWKAGVWPGTCHFPDFTDPKSRQWWTDQTANWVQKTGVSGLWNDMNEPATWGQDVPDMLEFSLENRKGSHMEAHNIYGQQMARSTRNGLLKSNPGTRPFVLTRAGFAGIQRYAAVWTGDNIASDDHMFLGIRMVLGLGISGVPFSGVDVGGFVGDVNRNLFIRWMSLAAFFPFFRIHSMIDSKDSEPWSYGELAESIVRNYIRLRYKLLPMLNTLFYQSSKNGTPVLVPYFWRQPNFDFHPRFQHQFYFGEQLLIVPVSSGQDAVFAEIPSGTWFHLFTGQKFEGNQQLWIGASIDNLPVFVKSGSMLITQTVGTHTLDPESQSFQLHIFHGDHSGSVFWYDDDGLSLDQKPEDRLEAEIQFDHGKNQLVFKRINRSKREWKLNQIYFWHFPVKKDKIHNLHIGNQSVPIQHSGFSWLETLPNFDPFENKSIGYFDQCLKAEIGLEGDEVTMQLNWH